MDLNSGRTQCCVIGRRADAYGRPCGIRTGTGCGGVEKNQQLVVLINHGEVRPSVTIEIAVCDGLRAGATGSPLVTRDDKAA